MGKPRKHKRGGPKSTRAGCLLCKPYKDQKLKNTKAAKTRQDLRAEAEHLLDVRSAALMSSKSLAAGWDNPEDVSPPSRTYSPRCS